LPQHRNGKERVVDEEKEVEDCSNGGDKIFFFCSIRNGRIVAANNSDDDDDRVIEMTGGGGLLVTLVIDFYVTDDDDDNDEEPRIGIHARNDESNVACCWRATHTRGRVRFLCLCVSVSVCVSLSRSQSLLLLLPADDDDAPGGRGTQRNATVKHGTRNRTAEHDNANERTTAFFSFILVSSLFLFPSLFFSVAYEWSGGVGSKGRRVHACMYSGEDKRTNIDDIFCVLACCLLLQQFPSMLL
jgi:hypothetical protein